MYVQSKGGQPNDIQLFICNRTHVLGLNLLLLMWNLLNSGEKIPIQKVIFLLRKTGIRQLVSMIKFKDLTFYWKEIDTVIELKYKTVT